MVSSDDERARKVAKDQTSGLRPASTIPEESLRLSRDTSIAGPVPPPSDPSPSTVTLAEVSGSPSLGKFRLVKVVGRGAFGEVFRAYDTELDRYVAVKLPRHGTISSTEESLLLREAKNVSRLKHPGIVPVFDVGRTDSACYIISEFVDGPTLAQEAEKRRFSFREAADLAAQLAEALDYAHREGIIHRDLKPSNVMLEIRGIGSSITSRSEKSAAPHYVARIVDFGLCKHGLSGASISGENEVLGTPAYMSPEQAAGESYAVDGRSDIYSLGVILYRLLVGDVPFRGDLSNVLDHVVHDPPKRPRAVDRSIPLDLEVICLKCLAKSPHERYPVASDVAADLRRWLDDMPIVARPASRAERAWRWCRRYPALAAMILITALATVIGGTAVVLQWQDKQIAGAQAAEALIDRLLEAPSSRLDVELARVRTDIDDSESELRRRLRDDALSDRARMRLQLALLPAMPELAEALVESMLSTSDAHEFLLLREELSPYAKRLVPRLVRAEREPADTGGPLRLRAALALLQYANTEGDSSLRSESIAAEVVHTPADETAIWAQAGQGLKVELAPALERLFADADQQAPARLAACRALASLFAGEPKELVRLVLVAEGDQQVVLTRALKPHRDEASPLLKSKISVSLPASEDKAAEQAARQQANILCALLQLGDAADVWPQLVHRPDPRVQTYFIHTAAANGVSPLLLSQRLQHEADAGVLYALVLALGGYSEKEFPAGDRRRVIPELRSTFERHSNAGVHSAARWLLTRWGAAPDFGREVPPEFRKILAERDWFYNSVGQCMVIVRGPVVFQMGSPTNEDDRNANWESLHERTIARSFAIAATETTIGHYKRSKLPVAEELPQVDGLPICHVFWGDVLKYCVWLNQQEKIGLKTITAAGALEFDTERSDTLVIDIEQDGYRLPSEAEWEYSCRAGVQLSRFYGGSATRFEAKYDYCAPDTKASAVGSKMPNRQGLFDMYGNVHEYTCSKLVNYPDGPANDDRALELPLKEMTYISARGGDWSTRPQFLRSAARNPATNVRPYPSVGFRIAKTIYEDTK